MLSHKDELEARIENQFRMHWRWLRKKEHHDVAEFVNSIISSIKVKGHLSKNKVNGVCDTCGKRRGEHYGTLFFCYDGDKDGRQNKFLNHDDNETGEGK